MHPRGTTLGIRQLLAVAHWIKGGNLQEQLPQLGVLSVVIKLPLAHFFSSPTEGPLRLADEAGGLGLTLP